MNAQGEAASLRPLAVSLLCGMAHSTQTTRAQLWANNGLHILLLLLQEEVRCTYVLDCANMYQR